MIKIIIYYILFILSSQHFLRKTEEDPLSYCYPLNITKSKTDNDVEIFCSGDECFGIINSDNTNTFSNVTILCNKISCKIIENTNDSPGEGEGKCNTNEKCENCIEIILICYKDRGAYSK